MELAGLKHLFVTVFLYNFATFMVIPAITDVTMGALCPGEDKCSLAIYLSGFQQAITGLGSLMMMPIVGNLSDTYGRKALLTLPMSLTVVPLVILAYQRTTYFFYGYYIIKILTAMFCDGSVLCLSLAYVVSTIVAVLAAVYMRVFLRDSNCQIGVSSPLISGVVQPEKDMCQKVQIGKRIPSVNDMVHLLTSSLTFTQAAVVAFFNNLAEGGIHVSLLYFLKAQFHFNKDEFADLLLIAGVAGAISQLLLMPVLTPQLGEERLLRIGLLAWSANVPYVATMFSVLGVFTSPCIRSIVSKQVGPEEQIKDENSIQGKAQGCISGICSFANIISPLIFTPLSALFLSEKAPFHFPGFSIMCIGFAVMIAFVQSIMIRAAPPVSNHKTGNASSSIIYAEA
ncbi:hypothetical protein GIB67_028226 [Kingdonia uniflora]|uniref:Uncharacterized protein n=1 Tax=Kingdonia uniflora TaxID=39325 RepID=A0A7J7KZ56_9MAGN|nr:hypothetical protein GIB67_028226 [Kingdonia uniflora]